MLKILLINMILLLFNSPINFSVEVPVLLFICMFFLKPSESLPPIDAVQQILPVYYKLVQQPPQRKDSVKPYLPVNEPEQTRRCFCLSI